MIQMFFMNVQKHANMWGYVSVFQLMAGQLTDQTGIRMNFFQNIKGWNTDISGKYGVLAGFLQNMIEKSGGRALSLGSGDADNTVTVSFKEYFHL